MVARPPPRSPARPARGDRGPPSRPTPGPHRGNGRRGRRVPPPRGVRRPPHGKPDVGRYIGHHGNESSRVSKIPNTPRCWPRLSVPAAGPPKGVRKVAGRVAVRLHTSVVPCWIRMPTKTKVVAGKPLTRCWTAAMVRLQPATRVRPGDAARRFVNMPVAERCRRGERWSCGTRVLKPSGSV